MERRSFLTGLISLIAAPAIVRVGSLMPVKSMISEPQFLLAGQRKWISFHEALDRWPSPDEIQRALDFYKGTQWDLVGS